MNIIWMNTQYYSSISALVISGVNGMQNDDNVM